jgi:glycosyltransferase involved in cell wall biosynthesis
MNVLSRSSGPKPTCDASKAAVSANYDSGNRPAVDVGSLRILIVSGLYPTAANPVEGIFVHEQAQALRRRGIDARVVTIKPLRISLRRPRNSLRLLQKVYARPDRVDKWGERDGVPVIFFDHLFTVLVPLWLFPSLRARVLKRALPKIARSFPYDLVHAHTAYWDGLAGAAAARFRCVPLVVTEHTGPLGMVLDNLAKRVQVRAALRCASAAIAVSSALAREIAARGLRARSDLVVVPNGVDTSFFVPSERPEGWRSGTEGKARIAPRACRALWIGNYVDVKRVDRLLEAFSIARQEVPGLRLTLLGDGPLKAATQDLVQTLGLGSAVAFWPATDRAGVRNALDEADFVVISSDVETFGVVGIEALAMGRPVVTTSCGGPEDYIRNALHGVIVSRSAEDLARGMVSLAVGERADPVGIREFAVAHYDYAIVVGRLIEIYQEVLPAR